MEWDNPFLTNEYSGIGYHISFFYFFWGGVTWDLYANFLDQRGGVIFEGALSLNRSNMLRREWSSNRNCFFLVWGKRFKADWVIILGKEISPRTCMRGKQVIPGGISFWVKSDYSILLQRLPTPTFLVSLFLLGDQGLTFLRCLRWGFTWEQIWQLWRAFYDNQIGTYCRELATNTTSALPQCVPR